MSPSHSFNSERDSIVLFTQCFPSGQVSWSPLPWWIHFVFYTRLSNSHYMPHKLYFQYFHDFLITVCNYFIIQLISFASLDFQSLWVRYMKFLVLSMVISLNFIIHPYLDWNVFRGRRRSPQGSVTELHELAESCCYFAISIFEISAILKVRILEHCWVLLKTRNNVKTFVSRLLHAWARKFNSCIAQCFPICFRKIKIYVRTIFEM